MQAMLANYREGKNAKLSLNPTESKQNAVNSPNYIYKTLIDWYLTQKQKNSLPHILDSDTVYFICERTISINYSFS